MRLLRQIFEVSKLNLSSLPTRVGTSAVIIVGIAGVSTVLVAILAMANGFETTLNRTGAQNQALVLRAGSDNEVSSLISLEEVRILSVFEGVVGVSEELFAVTDMVKNATGMEANLVVRGLRSSAIEMREMFRIVEGRNFEPGKAELIAGRGVMSEFSDIQLGSVVDVRGQYLSVVGIFEVGGTAYESEIWMDLPVAASLFRRERVVNSIRLRVDEADRIGMLQRLATEDPRLNVSIESEQAYFARQSAGVKQTLTSFGRVVAVIMAVGAALAAFNSMNVAVQSRRVEIGTLRAIGFDRVPIILSVLIEAFILALIGGVCGGGIAYFGFDDLTVSTLNEATSSQLAFDFAVTPALLREGLIWSLVLGAVGGFIPALRVARLPILDALRGYEH